MEKHIIKINEDVSSKMCLIDVAVLIKETAKQKNTQVEINFDGTFLIADESSTLDSIIDQYRKATKENIASTKKTSDIENSKKQQYEAKIIRLKKLNETLMAELETLDFKSHFAILSWIRKFQPCSEIPNTDLNKKKVLKKFIENGYTPSVNCNNNYDCAIKKDAANAIIEQVLNTLQKSASINSIVIILIDDWFYNFETQKFYKKVK